MLDRRSFLLTAATAALTPGFALAETASPAAQLGVLMDGLAGRVRELLDDIQSSLLARATRFRDEHTHRADDYDTFKTTMEGRPGFVIAPWCGEADCEAQIKTDTQATIRNMPIDGAAPAGKGCVRCGRPAVAEAWFAKAY